MPFETICRGATICHPRLRGAWRPCDGGYENAERPFGARYVQVVTGKRGIGSEAEDGMCGE